jgi:hypothetical protein
VGELERDEPAADEQYPPRDPLEVEECGAVDQVLGSGEAQRAGWAPMAIKKCLDSQARPSMTRRFLVSNVADP